MKKYIYNCPKYCPIRKHCFVITTACELRDPLIVLKKCEAEDGKDIAIEIGGKASKSKSTD